jgi:hypothetical protein
MRDQMDTMGPVDYIVVEFPDTKVPKDVLPRLIDLVDQGTVRILDLAFLRKQADGPSPASRSKSWARASSTSGSSRARPRVSSGPMTWTRSPP